MALYDQIQTALRAVPTYFAPTAGWSYRRLTSGPAAEERTYGAWTSVDAHVTGKSTTEAYDDQSAHARKEVARFRVSSALAELHQGDQVKDGQTKPIVWAVMGIVSSGIGTTAYMIERTIDLRAELNRQGGV